MRSWLAPNVETLCLSNRIMVSPYAVCLRPDRCRNMHSVQQEEKAYMQHVIQTYPAAHTDTELIGQRLPTSNTLMHTTCRCLHSTVLVVQVGSATRRHDHGPKAMITLDDYIKSS